MIDAVETYIQSVSDDRKHLFLRLQAMIYEKYSKVEVKISYGIPKYTHQEGWIYLGYWKKGVSLYTGIVEELAVFKAKHPSIKTGKGSINLKLGEDIPWQDITNIIDSAMHRL
jgi:uncharacterized protein YdhG (YjbR/CyaY superfamily)